MKNRSVVLIVLLTALLIVVVIWLYNKRIEKIEKEMWPVGRLTPASSYFFLGGRAKSK